MQKITLISDIHSRCDALKQVIDDADSRIICAGDIIGYGKDNNHNTSIELIREYCIDSIAGNWDRMATISHAPQVENYKGNDLAEKELLNSQIPCGGTAPNNKYYNSSTKNALEAIIANITPTNKSYLCSLPDTLSLMGIYYFVHGGFHESQLKNGLASSNDFEVKQFNYNAFITADNVQSQFRPKCIIIHGHTHEASVYYEGKYTNVAPGSECDFEIENSKGAVISLPSLGRNVDKPNFNGYAILETGKETTKIIFIETKI